MLQDLRGLCTEGGGQEVHGYVWQGDERAKGWWDRRGMETVWESIEGDGWGGGTDTTRRMFRADDETEYGYMRGRWARPGLHINRRVLETAYWWFQNYRWINRLGFRAPINRVSI